MSLLTTPGTSKTERAPYAFASRRPCRSPSRPVSRIVGFGDDSGCVQCVVTTTLGISKPHASRAARTSAWFIALATSTPAKPASRTSWKRSRRLNARAVGLRSVPNISAFLFLRRGFAPAGDAFLGSAEAERATGVKAARTAEERRNVRRFIRTEKERASSGAG
jgi:hypothetical protein